MRAHKTPLEGAFLIETDKFADNRGYFFESFNHQKFSDATGYTGHFVQDNQAMSQKNVIRGLHFQRPPYAQSKLVRALRGTILDVIVDIRKKSPTYGQWYGVELSHDNNLQLFVPKGFAHGYSVLSEDAVISYKCDEYYHPECEGGLFIFDDKLGIDWQVAREDAVLSEKDLLWPGISAFDTLFE